MADARQFVFGPGLAWAALASYLDTGVAPSVSVPVRFDVTQSIAIDFTLNPKELYGQNVFPTAVGVGQSKVTGKIIGGRINSELLQSAFYGASTAVSAGTGYVMQIDEPHTVPSISPYTVTVNNGATFYKNWSVRYALTGAYLTPVALTPTTGQYTVGAGGVYTFSSGDSNVAMLIDYENSVTTGAQFTVNSFFQGLITLYGLRYQGTFNGKSVGIWIPNAVGNKFTFNTKQQDFVMPEFDFTAFATTTNLVAQMYLSE